MNVKRALVKTAAGFATVAALGTAVIGAAHTRWGRPLLTLPLLRTLAQHAGCPVGEIGPEAFESVRARKLQGDVGSAEAAAHPALGFTLGQTRRANVEAWIATEKADCKADLVTSVLECQNVALPGAPQVSHLRLQFDREQRLVSVDLFRSATSPQALVDRFNALSRELDATVGPATNSSGNPSVAFMLKTPLQTVTRNYNYRDYVARALLLNLGQRGLRLRETYQWLPPRAPA